MVRPFGIYIHIPFCFHKCPYCDFNTYAVTSVPETEYLGALLAELDYRAALPEWYGRPLHSIFFGGGTPSLLSVSTIRKIISMIELHFPSEPRIEITLEANPGTISTENLVGYRKAGVNRLSIGAQSMLNDTLRSLGRMHTPLQVESGLAAARAAGFTNVNLDLMFAAPNQTLEDLKTDLNLFFSLKPDHISPYGLTIEKGTPFYTSYKNGALKLPNEKRIVEMMEYLNTALPERGFLRYEISNFALPSFEARHNLAYWNGDDYMGLGAGAHSLNRMIGCQRKVFGKRWSNLALPQTYIEQSTTFGRAEAWQEELSLEAAVFEYFFLGLRKIEGVSLARFQDRFHCTVSQAYPALLQVLLDQQLIVIDSDRLRLSERGLLLADSVIENFVDCDKAALHRSQRENSASLLTGFERIANG